MDKYMENAALRHDLRWVTDQLDELIAGLEAEEQIDWHRVEKMKGTKDKVYNFYGFKPCP